MEQVELHAYAKINLALDVLRKREDGYHEVRMIMQSVKLYDKLRLIPTQDGTLTLRSNLRFLPQGEQNLAWRAAQLFRTQLHIKTGVFIRLYKKIPIAAGLAGGSTDAAATLIGMDELFHTHLSTDELLALGSQLGADVPFCMQRGTMLAEGIGERLTPLPRAPRCYCLLVKPPFGVSTRHVYEALTTADGGLSADLQHPDIDGMLHAIQNDDLYGVADRLGNVLETVTLREHPELAQLKERLREQGAIGTLMSGSGPTIFGLFDDHQRATAAYYAHKTGPYGRQTFLTELL